MPARRATAAKTAARSSARRSARAGSSSKTKSRTTKPPAKSSSVRKPAPKQPAARPSQSARPAGSVQSYLDSLPADRREVLEAVRNAILSNLPAGLEEGIQYGMISYHIPHSVYPQGYHCDPSQPVTVMCISCRKGYYTFASMLVYAHEPTRTWFQDAWKKSGRKLDMGKSCVRFKKLDDVPLDVVAQAARRSNIPEFLRVYEDGLKSRAK